MRQDGILSGLRVVEHCSGVAGAWAGRLLAALGAEVILIEPPGGLELRRRAPLFDNGSSALFAYVAAGKRSVICDLSGREGQGQLLALLESADIFIDDTPVAERRALGLKPEALAASHPGLVYLSVLPFGAVGPKAGWKGEEVNLIHAGGEGYLLPNGLSADLFPERPPLKIAGHFAEMQGGTAAALAGLAALWSGTGQFVDASTQEANVAVGCFALQRFGDGSVEHRLTRSFRFGGVIECADGHVELLTLEERQWQGLLDLMGRPEWSRDPALDDVVERSARGDEINRAIRAWARGQNVDDLVARAQEKGVPMARYNTPAQVLAGPHEQARGIFQRQCLPGVGEVSVQAAPFRIGEAPPRCAGPAPVAGADQHLIARHGTERKVTA